ncbi:signal peptide peptidase SppA [Candidatus Latescibacterota bacterium]
MLNKRGIWIGLFVIVIVAAFVLFSSIVVISLSMDGFSVAQERIAIVKIVGPILSSEAIVEKLERHIDDDSIPAIVLRLNTPGGGVAASQEIYEAVKKVRQAGKKVVVSMGSVAASGGYYIAVASDTVLANPGTITGSIGVIANFADFSGLFQKIGIDFPSRKSGKFKDMGSTSRKMTDEEKELLDLVIMDTHDQFVQAVSEGRNLDPDVVRSLADGRIFTGRQALKAGLIDALGTYQDAIDLAGAMTGLGENPPVLKEKKNLWEELILGTIVKYLWIGTEGRPFNLFYKL